jgi:hypothetical protein
MPFETLETITKANAPPTAVLSYMCRTQKPKPGKPVRNDKDRKPSLMVTLPTTMCGTSKSETFALLIGTGADIGKLRIKGIPASVKGAAPSPAGAKPSQMKHAFRFNFGFVPKLGEDHFDGERRPVKKINNEEFEIEVPSSWFK